MTKMNKIISIVVITLVILFTGFYTYNTKVVEEVQSNDVEQTTIDSTTIDSTAVLTSDTTLVLPTDTIQ